MTRKVPQWGTHDGVKYSPKRSILKICPICNEFFLQVSRGKKKYCNKLCSIKAKIQNQKEINRKMIKNRDKFEHANYMMRYRQENVSIRRLQVGTDYVPNPELKEDGTVNWNEYHQMLQGKLQKLGLN